MRTDMLAKVHSQLTSTAAVACFHLGVGATLCLRPSAERLACIPVMMLMPNDMAIRLTMPNSA